MHQNNKITQAVRHATMLAAVATTSVSTTIIAAENAADVERIQVTGSRITRADIETASPVTVINSSAIAASGVTSIGELLQNLSVASGAMTNPALNNASGGNSTINLRGLGNERTLVLLNSRRMIASGTGAASSVDLNTIPIAMIERIEVLKDGASAVYGTDAVAGVVNVILKRNFEGAEFNAQTGSSFQGDGEESSFDFTLGTSSNKGNIVFGLQYTQRKAARQANRDFSDCPIWDDLDGTPLYCGGSSSSLGGHIYGNQDHGITFTGVDELGDAIPAIGDSGRYGHYIQDDSDTAAIGDTKFQYFDQNVTEVELSGRNEPEGSYHDFIASGDNNDLYNYASVSYLSTPMQRLNLSASGTYELTNDITFFSEATYTKRWSESKMAPEPVTFNFNYDPTWMTNVSGIETGEELTYRRRLLESGARIFKHNVDTIRVVLGVEGELDNGWSWDVSYNKGKNDSTEQTQNYHYKTGIDNAITSKNFDPLSQAAWQNLSAFRFTEIDTGGSEMDIIAASLTGELLALPAGELAFAAGYEHRKESAFFTPGSIAQLGLGADDPIADTDGSFSVDEAYLELAIPLLANKSFAEHVELSTAIRYFDYNTFGDDTTWKLGLTWKVNKQLMLRGVASTAFRAPTVDELYGGVGISFEDVKHVASPSGQALVTVGSNDNLNPEEAETFTAGIVFEPNIIAGLSLTLDYFNIALSNAIGTIDSNYVAKTCLSASGTKQNNDLAMCKSANISLNAGQIEFTNLNGNIGTLDTSGLDVNIAYHFELANLDVRASLDTMFLTEYEKEASNEIIDYKGKITGDIGSYAQVKSNFNLSVRADTWSASYQARYISAMDDISCAPNECLAPSTPSVIYHDVSGTYQLTSQVTLAAGVNNLFDKQAPFYSNYNDSNTDPYTYDVLGRYGFVKVKVEF